ncbi:MAG: hypothetical protein P8X90_30160 [Desulfobacterales bacterium]
MNVKMASKNAETFFVADKKEQQCDEGKGGGRLAQQSKSKYSIKLLDI